MTAQQVTVLEARIAGRSLLHEITDTAQLDADLILAEAMSVERSMIETMSESRLDTDAKEDYENMLARRLAGEPIAYITRRKEFWSLEFHVNEHTLVPRPETELIVERVLALCQGRNGLRIADLGTGCGTIALAIASELAHASIFATDQSADALRVAKINRSRFGFDNVDFNQCNWLEDLPVGEFDVICSNPPYIAKGDTCLEDPAMRWEPREALISGADELDAIRPIVSRAGACLTSGGWLVIEHGFDQGSTVRSMMREYRFQEVRTSKDLAGLERVTEGRLIESYS